MISKESAKKEIAKLVAQFREHESQYKNKDYNETQTRQEFIDPFFKALGWDIDNKAGIAPSYKEVQHEDRVKVEGKLKSPDYSFRHNGKRFFFVEAKKPSVNIKDDSEPAYQIRRYAWSANLKLSILTDFEEFAYYDCTSKPSQRDKASKSRLNYIKFTEYIERFDELWNLFSKEAIINGSYDSYLKTEKKKGKNSVDDDFLESLLKWRAILANDIHKQNKNITEDHLNFVVQNTIDRIIFLRIAEDRHIEPYGLIKKTLDSKNIYDALFDLFKKADEKYNSGLFNFDKDKVSKATTISNKCLNEIIENLYFPNSPYEFSVIPVEILGSAYEQFLGKTIQIKGSKIVIEDKPEVRKAGGVYYTPQYIVDYIIQNTVSKLVAGKTPKEVEKIKILDPASGSGSFLLGAYEYLLEYHLDWYTQNSIKSKGKKNDPLNPDGSLTTEIKKRILLNNIYGVDIDINAVEVTKLSLLLKCLEGETEASLRQQLSLFQDRVLPTLDSNIKCGNTLVDTDYYEIESDRAVLKRVKPFNWELSFPEVFKQGGFDVVIGNPPYVNISILDKKTVKYFASAFKEIHTGYNDLMYYFICKTAALLTETGMSSMIVSNYFLGNKYAQPLRLFLKNKILKVVNFKFYLVFLKANVHTCIISFKKFDKKPKVSFFELISSPFKMGDLKENFNHITCDRAELEKTWLVAEGVELKLIEKICCHSKLASIAEIEKGSTSGKNSIFTVTSEFARERKFEKEILRKNIKNGNINKYSIQDSGEYLIYVDSSTDIFRFPKVYKYLEENKIELSSRNEVKKKLYEWYRLERPRNKSLFDSKEKIIVPYRAVGNRFAYDDQQRFNDGGDIRAILITNKSINTKYVLGILNSKLIDWFYGYIGKPKGKVREYFNEPLGMIPIPTNCLEFDKISAKITDHVKKLLELKKDPNPDQNQIDHYEKEIDALAYELYGLTGDEIKLVEEATSGSGK